MKRFLMAVLVVLGCMPLASYATEPVLEGTAPIAGDPSVIDPWPAITVDPVPEKLRGIWAKPDCAMADKMFVMSEFYIMKAWPQIYFIGPVRNVRDEPRDGDVLYHIPSRDYSVVMKRSEDGLMKANETPVHPMQPLYMTWGQQQDWMADEFTACSKLFGTSLPIGQEEVNTPFVLDIVHKGCKETTRESFAGDKTCHDALFAAVDFDGDKLISKDDLERLYRQSVFMVSATAQMCNQRTLYTPEAKARGGEFAAQVLAFSAPAADAGYTQAEMTALLAKPGFLSGRVYEAVENLRNLDSVMAFMPRPDSAKTCMAPEDINARDLGTVPAP